MFHNPVESIPKGRPAYISSDWQIGKQKADIYLATAIAANSVCIPD